MKWIRTALVSGAAWIAAAVCPVAGAAGDSAAVPTEAASAAMAASMPVPSGQQPAAKPLWKELTPAQQQALAPLASEWDRLDAFRKNKWLAIGNKFATMSPDERQRVQARMRDWVALTPDQRRIARESYARAKKLPPDRKSAHWEQYQQLPDEQKRKLAAEASARKPVAALPPPASQGKNSNTLPPIKSTPKPALERPVEPPAAGQAVPQASSPSSK